MYMKQSLTTRTVLTIGIMLPILTAPMAAFAQAETTKFCTNLSQTTETTLRVLLSRESKLSDKEDDALEALEERIKNRDEKIDQSRSVLDQKREQELATLKRKATTDTQRQAVAAFETTYKGALTARRSAIDTAFETYDAGITKLIGDKAVSSDTLLDTFAESIRTAITAAETNCTTSPATAQKTYLTSIQKAKTTLVTGKNTLEKIRTNIQKLSDTRKAAVKEAEDTYKETMQSAAAALKAALNPQ